MDLVGLIACLRRWVCNWPLCKLTSVTVRLPVGLPARPYEVSLLCVPGCLSDQLPLIEFSAGSVEKMNLVSYLPSISSDASA